MSNHTDGLHHFHTRKRIHQKHEPYPHPDKWKRRMDKAIYVVGIIGPIMTIPQLYKIWIEKNASGVSLASWTTYLIISVFWLVYGIMHKERQIIFTFSLAIVVHLFVVIGIVMY